MQRKDNLTLSFDEPTHTYTCSDGRVFGSVTETIEHYFSKFEPDKVIAGMMASRNWPNSEYYGMTPEEIKAEWTARADRGTRMHAGIERMIKSACTKTELGPRLDAVLLQTLAKQVANDPLWALQNIKKWSLTAEQSLELQTEFTYFASFTEQVSFLEYVLPELRVFCPQLQIAGTIDLLTYDNEGNCRIYDWKRVGKMRMENKFQKGKAPFANLEDCNYNHYQLQLNLYRHILEGNYTLAGVAPPQVKEMKLFIFHPSNPNYVCHPVARNTGVTLIRKKYQENI